MSANIPDAPGALPGSYVTEETVQNGISIPGNVRIPVIIGEGLTGETLVGSANGNGNDGFNPEYTSRTGADGRHFLLGSGAQTVAPVVPNRSQLLLNGVPLTLLEGAVTGNGFDQRFQAILDPTTGEIELQGASLVEQGVVGGNTEIYYLAASSNAGSGMIENLQLVDLNAPTETWTITCSTVLRDQSGNPIDGYAKFVARGSVSGILLDG